jgi:hypothetical protein
MRQRDKSKASTPSLPPNSPTYIERERRHTRYAAKEETRLTRSIESDADESGSPTPRRPPSSAVRRPSPRPDRSRGENARSRTERRKQRLAEQGWVESHGKSGWSITRVDFNPPQKNTETQTKTEIKPKTEAQKALKRKKNKRHKENKKKKEEMEKLAAEQCSSEMLLPQATTTKGGKEWNDNYTKRAEQEAVEAAVEERTSEIQPPQADSLKSNARSDRYSRNFLNGPKIGALPASVHADAMAEKAEKNSKDISFKNRFEGMLAKHDGKKVPANSTKVPAGDRKMDLDYVNYDADRSTSNISETGAENESSNQEPVLGKRRSVWVRDIAKEAQKATRAAERAREMVEQAEFKKKFNDLLAKHDRKRNQSDNMDFEMSYGPTMHGGSNNHDRKRKREYEDEDVVMESTEYMRFETGRKR